MLCAALATLIATGMIHAQQQMPDSLHTTEEYRNYLLLEVAFGMDVDLAHRNPANKLEAMSYRKPRAFAVNLRATHFLSHHWGWFADIEIVPLKNLRGKAMNDFVGRLEQAYYVNTGYENMSDTYSLFGMSFGGAYRMAFGRWTVYPKLGIGLTVADEGKTKTMFGLKEKGGQGIYSLNYTSPPWDNYSDAFAIYTMSCGIGVNYEVFRGLRLTFDATYTQPLGRQRLRGILTDLYTGKTTVYDYQASTIGRRLSVSLGIGVPIYFGKKGKTRSFHTDHSLPMRKRVNDLMRQKSERFGWKRRKREEKP
jgi:hypothetical protein